MLARLGKTAGAGDGNKAAQLFDGDIGSHRIMLLFGLIDHLILFELIIALGHPRSNVYSGTSGYATTTATTAATTLAALYGAH